MIRRTTSSAMIATIGDRSNAPIGGIKVTTENAWFAARPSGTEDIYKIYVESFRGTDHMQEVARAAQEIVDRVLKEA